MRLGVYLFAVGVAIMVCAVSYLVGKKAAVHMWHGQYEMAAAGIGVMFLMAGTAVYIANLIHDIVEGALRQ